MKKVLFFFLVFSNVLHSQVTFQAVTIPPSVSSLNLFSISSQGSNLYIAGDGCLLKSINNGTSWSVMLQNSNYYFFDVKFTDSQNGYAVGWPKGADALNKISTLFKTVDGGLNWILFYSSSRKSSASTRFNEGEMRNGAIDFLDESRLIWGCGTTQFYSASGGRGNHCTVTTVQTYSASLPNINKAFVGSSGLLESLKGGVAFGISGYQSSDYYDLDLVTADDLYAVDGDEIYKIKVNQTNTSSFKSITGASTTDFYGIDFLDVDYGYVVGKSGKVAYTTNGGTAWTNVTPFSSEQLNDLLFYNNSNAIIIGNNGTVLKMTTTLPTTSIVQSEKPIYNETDITWSNISSGTNNDLFEINVKGGITFVAGDGVILKSTDLGNTFSSVYTNPIYKFRDISFVDASVGWVIAYNISMNRIDVLKTTNGGANWTLQTSMPGSSAGIITGLVIEAYNSSYVLASYADALNSVKKITSDGGVSWTNVGGNYEAAPISDFIFFGTNYTSSGHQGFGSKRTDGGTYVAQNLDNGAGGTLAGCTSLTYSQWIKNYGMNAISTSDNHLSIARDMEFLTTPQTQTGWIERTNTPSPLLASDWGCYPTYTATHYYGVKMISSSEIWLCGEKGTVITTRNAHGGIISSSSEPNPQKEWFGHNTGTLNELYDIESLDPSTFLAIGKSGTIIRTSNANSTNYLSNAPTVTTNTITNVTTSTANGGGNVIIIGSNTVTTKGICWSTNPNPTIVDNITSNGSGTGTYTSNLAGLTPGTIYYVRAYATNAAGTAYGNQISFSTPNIPTITTNSIINITGTTASSGGNISSDGGTSITTRGVCWSVNPSPTILNNITTNGTGIGTFSSNLTGLISSTTYYLRAYATNAAGTAYGNQISFTTLNFNLPSINTNPVTNFSISTASSGGDIISDGGSIITSRGVCWSTSINPNLMNSFTSDGIGTGVFTSNLNGLTLGTVYHVRAYATNAIGTSYGNDVVFVTPNLPIVTTSTISNINVSSANTGGNVLVDGGSAIISRGVCWSTSPNPNLTANLTLDGSGTGIYVSGLTGLIPGTIYYVRAYATNAAGTAYGNQISFSTPNIPTVTTNSIINITGTTASSGGNISSDGGTSITTRGVCWSVNPSPTILNNLTTNGTGIGTFSSNLTGLISSTTYYVRAYATNAAGTAYGNQISFTTSSSTTGIIDTINSEVLINIYPNPSNNIFKIQLTNDLIGSELEILSIDGKLIHSMEIIDNKIDIDLSNCFNGLYILRINHLSQVFTKKIIKN